MPTWPPVAGRRTITLAMPADLVTHLDAQAAYLGCTRAAYARRLVIEDRDRSAQPAGLTADPDLSAAQPVSFEMPDELIAYLDTNATAHGCSRAAYIRHLVACDIRRQG